MSLLLLFLAILHTVTESSRITSQSTGIVFSRNPKFIQIQTMSRERPRRAALPPAQENIDRLEKVVNEGNYYGAQQIYKSISARYVSAQRVSEALDILQSGACIQLQNGQVTCGAELALFFVETLVKGKIPYNDETLGLFYSPI